jgi:hypothetical protein
LLYVIVIMTEVYKLIVALIKKLSKWYISKKIDRVEILVNELLTSSIQFNNTILLSSSNEFCNKTIILQTTTTTKINQKLVQLRRLVDD